jgi:hypothetical protein
VAALACAPWLFIWPLTLYYRAPALFYEWLVINNFGRFLGTNEIGPPADTAHYLRILPWYALPALPLAAWALWRTPFNGLAAPACALPLSAYALPLVLPLALLATPATDTLRRGAANLIYWFSLMGGGVFLITAWFYWGALELSVPPKLHDHLLDLQPGYETGFKWLPFVLGALYTASWLVLLARLAKTRERPVVAWAATMTMIWGLLAILFVGWIDAGKSYRAMIADMQKALPPKYQCMASLNLCRGACAQTAISCSCKAWPAKSTCRSVRGKKSGKARVRATSSNATASISALRPKEKKPEPDLLYP